MTDPNKWKNYIHTKWYLCCCLINRIYLSQRISFLGTTFILILGRCFCKNQYNDHC